MRRQLLSVIILGFTAFVVSFGLNASIQGVTDRLPLHLSLPFFFVVVLIGVLTDALGLACTKGSERAILSMASRKVKGAREGIFFIRNASRMSSVFNDVMGDISATLSGAFAVAIVYKLKAVFPKVSTLWLTSAAVASAAFLTIGGKAFIKPLALKKADAIVLWLGRMRRFILILGRKGHTKRT